MEVLRCQQNRKRHVLLHVQYVLQPGPGPGRRSTRIMRLPLGQACVSWRVASQGCHVKAPCQGWHADPHRPQPLQVAVAAVLTPWV